MKKKLLAANITDIHAQRYNFAYAYVGSSNGKCRDGTRNLFVSGDPFHPQVKVYASPPYLIEML